MSGDLIDARLAALERLTEPWPVEHVSVTIVHAGGEVAWGAADHVYRLASLSKPITAWAVLVAVEEGTVALDEPPAHVSVQPGCTVRHLLAHAGGYAFDGREPIAEPGRTRIYSNTGFELLATEVERAAAMPFGDYLREAVFEPLGMASAVLRGSPAHGVWCTAGDTARFVRELRSSRLLAAATATDALQPQYPDLSGIVPGVGRFTPCPWGLGVELRGDKQPHWTGRANSAATAGHFGGAGTMMWFDPVADCGLVALTDRPFDEWAPDALRSWRELSDAVVAEVVA